MEGNKHGWGWLGLFVSFGGSQPTTTTAHSLPWNPGVQETNRSASSRSLPLSRSLSPSLPRFHSQAPPNPMSLFLSFSPFLLFFSCLWADDQRLLIDLRASEEPFCRGGGGLERGVRSDFWKIFKHATRRKKNTSTCFTQTTVVVDDIEKYEK